MSVIARRPKWEQFRESNVLRASPEQRVLGRVDAVGSIGYWWQTAERTDVARTFQEGRRRVEEALHLGGGVVVLTGVVNSPVALSLIHI